jgi:chromosome segregation ATPase
MEYGGGDYFNQLKGKVNELKQRRDHVNQDLMKDRMTVSHLDEQIATLNRERQRAHLDVEMKNGQLHKFNELIDQSETALNKMIQNT